MNNSFEHMQKLAFGKIITGAEKEVLTENALKAKIKELVHSSLGEAKKKKKEEDVAPQEDVDLEMSATEEMPEDTIAPEPTDGADIDPTVKSIQDSLQKAYALAQQLGDEKLATQIGNTLTMLLRDQVLGLNKQQ
jgi:spore coat polysaccharide biosynthesis protein SpsF (cytidylyltransferase family)